MSTKEKYRQSETVIVKRSQINFAPYNPKKHSEEAVKQIRDNIKRVAFLGGIIWNEVTGNLIDGHKRVMALDIINKYDGSAERDYDIKVEKISLDEKTEKEQNIFQTKSRTDLDDLLLAELLKDVDVENTGLTDEDLKILEVVVPDFDFGTVSLSNEHIDTHKKSAQKSDEVGEEEVREEGEGDDDSDKESIKAKKEAYKNKIEGAPYVTLTFDSFDNKVYFMERFGFDPYQVFIKGERFEEMIERIE